MQHSVWIVEDATGECRFIAADGEDLTAEWSSADIRHVCLGTSIQVWGLGALDAGDPDLVVAEGL